MPSVDCLPVPSSGTVPKVTPQRQRYLPKPRAFLNAILRRYGYKWLYYTAPDDFEQCIALAWTMHGVNPDLSVMVDPQDAINTVLRLARQLAQELGFHLNREESRWFPTAASLTSLITHAAENWSLDRHLDARKTLALVKQRCTPKQFKILCAIGSGDGVLQVSEEFGLSPRTCHAYASRARVSLKSELEGYIS